MRFAEWVSLTLALWVALGTPGLVAWALGSIRL